MTEREKLLGRIRAYDFALADVILFLDSHPKNSAALAYFHKMRAAFEKAQQEYQTACGPLTAAASSAEDRWNWVCDPWPWEGEEN